MTKYVCPEGDWVFDTDDDVEGYSRLFNHEEGEHPDHE